MITNAPIGQTNYTQNFTYDAVGNLLTSPVGIYLYQGNTGTLKTNPHTATSINAVTNTYDANGNLLSDGTLTNTWNYKNQLTKTVNGNVTSVYTYDHTGQRVKMTSGGVSTYYPSKYYNIDSNGKITKHIFANDILLTTITSGTPLGGTTPSCTPPETGDWTVSTSCIFTGSALAPASVIVTAGKLLTLSPNSKLLIDFKHYKLLVKHTGLPAQAGGVLIKKGSTLRQVKTSDINTAPIISYILTDHLSSANVVTDSTGTQKELLDYYPYGSIRLDTGSFKEQRKYIGQEYDEATKLNYLNARYYNNERGQFISEDPQFWNFDQAWLLDPQNQNSPRTTVGSGLNSMSGFGLSGNTQLRGNSISQFEYLADPQAQNSYAYARNNPLKYIDPQGETPALAPALIGGIAGAVGGFVQQYHEDVINNLNAGQTGVQAYLPSSGIAEYGTNISTGAAVGAASAYSLILGGIVAVGGSVVKNLAAHEQVNYQQAATQGVLTTVTGGLLKSLPQVPGRLPNLFTGSFFTGAHTQRTMAEEVINTSVQSVVQSGSTIFQSIKNLFTGK